MVPDAKRMAHRTGQGKQATQSLFQLANPNELLGFVVAISLIFSEGCSLSTRPKVVSVCELLGDIESHRGTFVSVRGIYFGGLQQNCPEPFRVGDRTYASVLNLTVDFKGESGVPTAFHTDRATWDELERIVVQEGKAGRKEEIWITITGKFDAVRKTGAGKIVGGYGHLGVLGADIFVKRVSGIEIRQEPTFDYSRFAGPAIAQ